MVLAVRHTSRKRSCDCVRVCPCGYLMEKMGVCSSHDDCPVRFRARALARPVVVVVVVAFVEYCVYRRRCRRSDSRPFPAVSPLALCERITTTVRAAHQHAPVGEKVSQTGIGIVLRRNGDGSKADRPCTGTTTTTTDDAHRATATVGQAGGGVVR